MNIRQSDKLANLPTEDRAKLDDWLHTHPYRRVVELSALPRPDGLNLKTNIRALSRYFNKFLVPDPLIGLANLASENPKAAETATAILLQAQAIQAASVSVDQFDARKFTLLLRFQERLREKAYRERLWDYRERLAAFRNFQAIS